MGIMMNWIRVYLIKRNRFWFHVTSFIWYACCIIKWKVLIGDYLLSCCINCKQKLVPLDNLVEDLLFLHQCFSNSCTRASFCAKISSFMFILFLCQVCRPCFFSSKPNEACFENWEYFHSFAEMNSGFAIIKCAVSQNRNETETSFRLSIGPYLDVADAAFVIITVIRWGRFKSGATGSVGRWKAEKITLWTST